jgi:hypothetical protein
MADNGFDTVAIVQRIQKREQLRVLRLFERLIVTAFKLNADRVVIASVAPLPGRHTCMPCSSVAGYELDQFTGSANQEMRRNPKRGNLRIVRMLGRIKRIGE